MNHYKEYDGFKLYDNIYVLQLYDIKETYIQDIFDDYPDEESKRTCKFFKTEYGDYPYYKVYTEKSSAEYIVQQKKNSYDRWALSRY